MSLSIRRKWFLAGAIVGSVVPVGFFVSRFVEKSYTEPTAILLFWPTCILVYVAAYGPYVYVAAVLAWLSNALLYGTMAMMLRRACVVLVALLLLVVWLSLPPSEETLLKRFAEHRGQLQNLVEMAYADPNLRDLAYTRLKTVDGKSFTIGQPGGAVGQERWNDYRKLFDATGVRRLSRSGRQVFLIVYHFDRFERLATFYGYVYCPAVPQTEPYYMPCSGTQPSVSTGEYRYTKIAPNWYLFEIFGPIS